MKKTALILIGLMASGSALAAQLAGGKNTYAMTDCSLLANDITISLSANAAGGVACNTTTNIVALSICHTKGLRNERSSVVTTDATGTPTCTVTSAEDCIETVSGATFPRASTIDGTVRQFFPGGGASCDAGTAETHATSLAGS